MDNLIFLLNGLVALITIIFCLAILGIVLVSFVAFIIWFAEWLFDKIDDWKDFYEG